MPTVSSGCALSLRSRPWRMTALAASSAMPFDLGPVADRDVYGPCCALRRASRRAASLKAIFR
jgi:hypothetical protein